MLSRSTSTNWSGLLRYALNATLRQKGLSLDTKLRLYQTCVLQILLYGADTLTLLADDTRRLQSFHFMPTPDTGCEVAGPCQEHRHSRQDLLLNVQWKP